MNKVKVQVPKVRRNTGEVRPYNEVRGNRDADHLLLWGTTAGLFALMLAGGAYLWAQGQAAASSTASNSQVQLTNLSAAAALQEARKYYGAGDYERAESSVRIALALQSASGAKPSVEADARRLNALIQQQSGRYDRALAEWHWLRNHGATHADLRNLELCERATQRSTERVALEQLRGAQKLGTRPGNVQRALAEARQALRSLQAQRVEKSSLQAAHLVVANLALQQGNQTLALDSLRQAAELGALTAPQRAVLARLERQSAPALSAASSSTGTVPSASLQVKVVVPRLADEASYPRGVPSGGGSSRKVMPPPEVTQEEEEEAPAPPLARRPGSGVPRVELPKLQMPSQGGQSLPTYQTRQGNSLPSYQSGSGSSLPSYSEKTRTRDTLPGY